MQPPTRERLEEAKNLAKSLDLYEKWNQMSPANARALRESLSTYGMYPDVWLDGQTPFRFLEESWNRSEPETRVSILSVASDLPNVLAVEQLASLLFGILDAMSLLPGADRRRWVYGKQPAWKGYSPKWDNRVDRLRMVRGRLEEHIIPTLPTDARLSDYIKAIEDLPRFYQPMKDIVALGYIPVVERRRGDMGGEVDAFGIFYPTDDL